MGSRDNSWVVIKYGGTSVATVEHWQRIARTIGRLTERRRVWVVASALSGVSDALDAAIKQALDGEPSTSVDEIRRLHRQFCADLGLETERESPVEILLRQAEDWLDGIRLTREVSPRLAARIMAVGELASTRLGALALARCGVDAHWVDARELLRATPRPAESDHDRYLEAHVRDERNPGPAEELAGAAGVVLTQGFIARNDSGETCLLGRGGSDVSASLFAALLGAEELQIWTDVPGMFTADPRRVPTARLIRSIGYREARELAATGARVLHPRCLGPVARAGIPLSVCSDQAPDTGTRVGASDEQHPAVTAVTSRQGVTLITLSTMDMWEAPGFLARAFAPFDELGISIDLVATSQSAVSMTLDRVPGGVGGPAFSRLLSRLEEIGKVEVIHPCGVVSVVGRRIRAVLPALGAAMEVFSERPVHLVSDSSEDLNLSFVVEEDQASTLVGRLHERLFSAQEENPRFGPTWESLVHDRGGVRGDAPWWRERAAELTGLVDDGAARFIYHLPTIVERARRLRNGLPSVGRVYYSMKANPHEAILRALAAEGLGLECVSAAEVQLARALVGDAIPLLFTPNFCPMEEYRVALDAGAEVIVDGPEPLERQPDSFRGVAIGVRIDPGRGLGHHTKVWTAGARAKFGHPKGDLRRLVQAATTAGARIVGLHAHVGSGILDPAAWGRTAIELQSLLTDLPEVRWIDLGGGLGVPERPGQKPLDLGAMEQGLQAFRRAHPTVELRIEPGRFLVSEAGVLLAPVTQVREKNGVRFAGLATGMNSLLRPALYGAWHTIHNLTRLDASNSGYWNVVGPICETSDVLGVDRLLPDTHPGDVLLIENAGAYGAVMSSRYNLREPAAEVVLDATG